MEVKALQMKFMKSCKKKKKEGKKEEKSLQSFKAGLLNVQSLTCNMPTPSHTGIKGSNLATVGGGMFPINKPHQVGA